MQLNYNEFMNLIPDETKKYVKIVMKYLYYFIIENNKISACDDNYYFDVRYNIGEQSNERAKFLLSTLLGLLHGTDTTSLVKRHSFSIEKYQPPRT